MELLYFRENLSVALSKKGNKKDVVISRIVFSVVLLVFKRKKMAGKNRNCKKYSNLRSTSTIIGAKVQTIRSESRKKQQSQKDEIL